MSAFALAKHLKQYYNKPVKIIVELLESVTGEEATIDGNKYYKNLDSVKTESGKTIKEKYLPYFKDILDKLKKLDNIEYEILFFYDYQKNPLVKKSLIKVINNYELLRYTLDPKNGEIRLKFPCPKCGLTEKHIHNTKIKIVTKDKLSAESFCPKHGIYLSEISENSIDKFDMNVPLRYLVKILFLMETDRLNDTLSVIVDGGDWSGSKLSKRMYVGNSAYREYLKEGLINYSKFYNQYGEVGFTRLYNEINKWILEPKKFIRDYTIEYIDAILKDEKINFI